MLADLVPFGPRFSTWRDSVPGQVYHHRSAIWTRSGGRILSRLRVVRSEVRGFPLPCPPTAPDAIAASVDLGRRRKRCGDAARGVVRRCMASDPVSHRLAEGRSVSALTADCRCRGKASARTLSQNQFAPCRIAAGRGKAVCRPRLDRSDSRGLALMAERVVDLRLR